jgi:hypothetical protein
MAGHHGASAATIDDDGTPPEVDIAAHQATFDAFISLTKWTIVFIVLLLIGMAVFLL